jgi:MFS transporter, PAT family, beta-lactamase induction signal transducer AmpG
LIVRLAQSPNWYARFNMCDPRRWPTPWAFGLLVLPLGMYVGFAGTALPFLLSKAGVPVDEIARIDALLALPPALMFLWTPVVDVKLRRRTWLVLGASATAFCLSAACPLLGASHLKLLTALFFVGGCTIALVQASCGGLMATMLTAPGQARAAAWDQAGNFGGGALGGALVLWFVERLSLPLVGLATGVLAILPALAAFTINEAPPIASHWFRGRLAEIRREGLAVLRSPKRRWSVLLLIAPGSTCAAQLLLPALASHYGVGGKGVMWTNGIAGGVALSLGSLCGVLVPSDWDRRLTYAGAGLTTAFGAIVLLTANRPAVYFVGTLLYLLTAGLCNAQYVALVLDVVGSAGHDSSTWFMFLTAVGALPIASMTWLEGQSFRKFGTHGLLWTDAAANLLVFTIVALVFATHGFGLRGAHRSQALKPNVHNLERS